MRWMQLGTSSLILSCEDSFERIHKDWEVFVNCVVGQENLPDWNRFWDDFTQEETQRGYLQGSSSVPEEEDVALATKGKQKFKRNEQKKDPI